LTICGYCGRGVGYGKGEDELSRRNPTLGNLMGLENSKV